MFIKNISVKILGVNGKVILPEETIEISDDLRSDVEGWINRGFIVETIAPKKAEKNESKAEPVKAQKEPEIESKEVLKPSDDEIKAATKKAELLALAGKYGVEVSSSMTVAQLRAALK